MGGTASTRRVTFEADENENITVVKGIRLSENVIDRMKESSASGSKSQRYSGAYGASVSDEELKRRVAEELALEQAKKESEDQKRLGSWKRKTECSRSRMHSTKNSWLDWRRGAQSSTKSPLNNIRKLLKRWKQSSSDMSLIQSVLICRLRFSSVTVRTHTRPSNALLWPASICTVSIMPNRACLRREDNNSEQANTINVNSRDGTFFFLVSKQPI
ncbi:MICOS complex subunit MIC19 isoform X5 [Sapajus apella]|uniref:MICOS complex subunit MIC19 isoform X5 n=1 Tax=Sapajus apella TaxID=9515 RepID=A0A6J3HP09_SAPAP|nr:MICOS complex subunit MIC19 isoform X5 [Sapajus apella]